MIIDTTLLYILIIFVLVNLFSFLLMLLDKIKILQSRLGKDFPRG